MKKITSKFMAPLLSLLTIVGTMTTPAFAAEGLSPGSPGALTGRYIDESTSRELAPPSTSKSSWARDAPAIEGYEFDSFSQTTDHIYSQEEITYIVGYPDGTFRPESEISRAETVTLINRLRNRKITAEELRALGVHSPYKDPSESYWAYGELIEATVKHNAADWHKLNYSEDNLNTVVERFVDSEGNELAEPIITKGQSTRSPRDFKNRSYLGYTTEITYVYRQGQAVMTGYKEVDKQEAKVGDTLTYSLPCTTPAQLLLIGRMSR